ncbi:hypothetical protein ASD93_08445 [Microbacterium sp. Root180]|nr:hypothetical protein ASD93_08445 [Microbacterium sp. Root180]
MRSLTGAKVTVRHATRPIGTGLRIVPEFRAMATDQPDVPFDTAIHARFDERAGRYVIAEATYTAREGAEINAVTLRKARTADVLKAAAPECITLNLMDGGKWIKASELTTSRERVLPWFIVDMVRQRKNTERRMEAVEIVYGVAALSNQPPTQAVQREFGIPHRTAADWISKAREAGHLEGMSYIAGRRVDG